jgi:hypothetical protein
VFYIRIYYRGIKKILGYTFFWPPALSNPMEFIVKSALKLIILYCMIPYVKPNNISNFMWVYYIVKYICIYRFVGKKELKRILYILG